MTRCRSEAPQVVLCEMVRTSTRNGELMFQGRTPDGRRVRLIYARTHATKRGEEREVWRLLLDAPGD